MESGFELGITCFDTMRNYRLSQKLKLLGYGEFIHLTTILIELGDLTQRVSVLSRRNLSLTIVHDLD